MVERVLSEFGFANATVYDVLRVEDGKWTGRAGTIAEKATIYALNRTLAKRASWRQVNSTMCYIPIPSHKAIVMVDCYSAPRRTTLAAIQEHIEYIVDKATYVFDATHDDLTGLLNRRAFEQAIMAELLDRRPQSVAPSAALQVPSQSRLFVIELDIDHFKQTNDTYGHLYGDIVLQSFAKRLGQIAADEKAQPYLQRATTLLARPSGEEFNLFVRGIISEDEVHRFADVIRRRIGELPLPSDEEWDTFRAAAELARITLPPLKHRTITVSVGVSAPILIGNASPTRQTITDALDEADVAMYRSKAGGRNTVTRFTEILEKHGSVLEHHASTNVVAIDIGLNVGVQVGQEFIVYHPDFTGEKEFLYNDGRTTRSLGKYPRRSQGRVVVFDPQASIAFCHVLESAGGSRFDVGARLEAVPLGSIGHYISTPSEHAMVVLGQPLKSADDVNAILLADEIGGYSCAVFALDGIAELTRQRGTQFINQSLGALYSTIREIFPVESTIAQVSPTELAVVWVADDVASAESLAKGTVERARASSMHLAQYRAGMYVPGAYEQSYEADRAMNDVPPPLLHEQALEYARYALRVTSTLDKDVQVFDTVVPQRVLYEARTAGQYERGLADYDRLRNALSVRQADVENQAAMMAAYKEPPDLKISLEAATRATDDFEPSFLSGVFWMNRGDIEATAQLYRDAFRSFEKSRESDPTLWDESSGFQFTVYVFAIVTAYYGQYQVEPSSVDLALVRRWIQRARDSDSTPSRLIADAYARAVVGFEMEAQNR